jgi:hypothetical protein
MRRVLTCLMVVCFPLFFFLRGIPASVFVSVYLGLLGLWVISYCFEASLQIEDIPLIYLIIATLSFGRAFSIIPVVSVGLIPIPITEIALALSFGLMLITWREVWTDWNHRLPKDLKVILPGYLIFGGFYLLLGLVNNGNIALRDIVFTFYMLFLFVAIHVFNRSDKIRKMISIITPSVITLLTIGFVLYFITRSGKISFIRFTIGTRDFNWALYYGLTAIFAISLFSLNDKKWKKIIVGVLIYFSMLFVLLTRVRAGWIGLVVGLILLFILLKREIMIVLVIIPLIAGSLFLMDTYFKKDTVSMIKDEIEGLTPGQRDTQQKKNVAFRLIIWKQALKKIEQKPLLGWGYGAQPDFRIYGKPFTTIRGIGPGSKITPFHNHVLAITFKMGVVGLLIFLYINFRIFLLGIVHLKNCRSQFNKRMLTGFLAALAYWHCMALFFDVLESPPTGIFLWIILALILCVVYVDRQKGEEI